MAMITEVSPHELSRIGRAGWLIPSRHDQPELLDQGEGSSTDVAANLREIWQMNRYLGGFRALSRHLYPYLRQHPEPITLLDLGTGSADIPAAIQRWASQNHLAVTVYGLDLAQRNLAAARRINPAVPLIQTDALNLPFAEKSVDYLISSLFLHHLTPEQVVDLLYQSAQVARRGLIMSDLVRGYLPYAAFRLIQPIFARHYLTRHDGIVSIWRGYTAAELLELARHAGLKNARVYQHFPYRMTLVVNHV